ncbi:unnamed protein product [Miscanthus lutarioriparius]|uniref:Major facilitator superfamily (MFS) profile domain-containing protein n=1 Tax=Miscanthus lutarioriparius TaxID=422564 RepID=A0A811MF48_9POAL|nr:unnamed protein product [Miscanthus lutarioriparius]
MAWQRPAALASGLSPASNEPFSCPPGHTRRSAPGRRSIDIDTHSTHRISVVRSRCYTHWFSESAGAANMETYTTDDALTLIGFGKFQALVLAYAGMGWLTEAMEVMLLSFLGPVVREEWNVSPQDESLLSSVVFAGMLIGACARGFISDRYGRKSGQWACIYILVLGVCSSRKSWHLDGYFFLFLDYWHSLGGFTCMGMAFVPSLQLIVFPFSFHGFLTGCTISIKLEVVSGIDRPSMLPLASFLQNYPESPRYLCAQNRMTDARLVLERMAIANQAALPVGVLTYHQETKTDYITHVSEDEHLIPVREKEHTVRNAIGSKSGAIAALRELLSHNLLRSTLLLWFVYYASSFAYYGIALLTSQLSDVNRSCKSGLIFEVHQNDGNLYKDTFITSLAGRIQCIRHLFAQRGSESQPPLVRLAGLFARNCHQMEAVLVFELVVFLAGVACILFPVETKGREMD